LKLYKNLATALKEREEVEALKVTLTGGTFPSELLMLPNLKELYLEGETEDFPKIGTPWNKLRVLTVKWPSFKGDISGLFSLHSLSNLKIIETPLKRLTLPLGQIHAPLKSLTLKSCELTELPEEFSMLTILEELNLSGNKLSALPASFPMLMKLKRLNLDHNHFSKFPEQFRNMKGLSHLSIDGNKFNEDEKARIQREFNIWVN
jgi:Leucine-rich repeat (LRR) protein